AVPVARPAAVPAAVQAVVVAPAWAADKGEKAARAVARADLRSGLVAHRPFARPVPDLLHLGPDQPDREASAHSIGPSRSPTDRCPTAPTAVFGPKERLRN